MGQTNFLHHSKEHILAAKHDPSYQFDMCMYNNISNVIQQVESGEGRIYKQKYEVIR